MSLPAWMVKQQDQGVYDEDHPGGPWKWFRVNNKELKSKAKGINYRKSMNLSDRVPGVKYARFGSTVLGRQCHDDWVQVGTEYLPVKLDDKQVLQWVIWESKKPEETKLTIYEEAEKAAEEAKNAPPPKVPDLPLFVPAWPPNGASYTRAADYKKAAIGASYTESASPPPVPAPNSNDLSPTDQQVAAMTGPCERYTVYFKHVMVRSTPSEEGHIENYRYQGELVELFEWDPTGKFRHCLEGLNGNSGWMMVEHPEFGPLLKPLDALGIAAHAGDLTVFKQQLRRTKYKDLQGGSGNVALRAAAEKAHYECIVALIEGGLDAKLFLRMASRKGPGAPNLKEPGPTIAFISALSDQKYDKDEFKLAIKELTPELAETAEMIIDRLAYTHSLDGDDAESSDKEKECVEEKGGEPFMVVQERMAVRGQPDKKSEIIASLSEGDIVLLLEHDTTHCWRRHFAKEVKQFGWVLLEHETLGALVKPATQEEVEEAKKNPKKDLGSIFQDLTSPAKSK